MGSATQAFPVTSRLQRWALFAHGTDVGLRGRGPSLAIAFAQAGVALTAAITDPSRVAAREAVEIRCSAHDPGSLLVNWLNALIHEMAVRRMLFSAYEVRTDGRMLQARCLGEPLDAGCHEPAVEVKRATPTGLRVEPIDGGWVAECVVVVVV